MTMSGMMLPLRLNWQQFFSYGEVVCFMSAWAVGLIVAMQDKPNDSQRLATRTIAASADTLGIQAKLDR
jgi:hypothetical protein